MKKYVKPELFYESFELTTLVASCEFDLNQAAEGVCSFINEDMGITVFNAELRCDFEKQDIIDSVIPGTGPCYFTGGSTETTDTVVRVCFNS